MLRRLFALLSLCLLLNPAATAANLGVGDTVPPLALADQFDQPHTLAADTRWLLFSHDRAVSDALHPVLAALPAAQRDGVVYVADISRMPALVSHAHTAVCGMAGTRRRTRGAAAARNRQAHRAGVKGWQSGRRALPGRRWRLAGLAAALVGRKLLCLSMNA